MPSTLICFEVELITLLSNYMMVPPPTKKRLQFKIYDDLQLFVKIFTTQRQSALYKQGRLELKEKYAHIIHSPMEHIH